MQIGENIRAMRRRCGFTQEELAAQLSVTPQAVSKWENGNGMPDITQLVPLAQIFGTTTDTLLGGGRSPARPCRAAYGRQCAGTAPAFGCVCRRESKHPQSEIIKNLRSVD